MCSGYFWEKKKKITFHYFTSQLDHILHKIRFIAPGWKLNVLRSNFITKPKLNALLTPRPDHALKDMHDEQNDVLIAWCSICGIWLMSLECPGNRLDHNTGVKNLNITSCFVFNYLTEKKWWLICLDDDTITTNSQCFRTFTHWYILYTDYLFKCNAFQKSTVIKRSSFPL